MIITTLLLIINILVASNTAYFSSLWFIPIASIAWLYFYLHKFKSLAGIFTGSLIFFFTYYLVGLWWLGYSFVNISVNSTLVPWILTVIFLLSNAIISSLLISLSFYIPRNKYLKMTTVSLSIWVADFLREYFLSGFEWLSFGYSQVSTYSLAGFIPVIGVHGVSSLVVLCAILLYLSFYNRSYSPFLALCCILLTSNILNKINWTQPDHSKEAINIAIVQAVPSQREKKYIIDHNKLIRRYISLTQEAKKQAYEPIDWILLPESAFIDLNTHSFKQFKRANQDLTVFAGVNIKKTSISKRQNGIIKVNNTKFVYHKTKLIPFAEQTPKWGNSIKKYLNLRFDEIIIPSKLDNQNIYYKNTVSNFFICYEVGMSKYWLSKVEESNFFILFSSMLWYSNTNGPMQLFQMARARSIETGRPVTIVSDTGYSSVIYPDNNDTQHSWLEPMQIAVLLDQIKSYSGKTPYSYLAYYEFTVFIIYSILLLTSFYYRKKNLFHRTHKSTNRRRYRTPRASVPKTQQLDHLFR